MKTDHQVLEEAIQLIEDPSRWTQHALGRDIHGNKTDAFSGGAVAWCAKGAIGKAIGRNGHVSNYSGFLDQMRRIAVAISTKEGGTPRDRLVMMNDSSQTLHSDIILAMKRALDKV